MVALTPTTNPVEWQETKHQQRSIPTIIHRWRYLAPIGGVVGVGTVIWTLRDVTSPTRDLAIFLVWLIHVITAVRAIAGGANAISREHTGLTWDSLVMTGISARKILLGKWVAVMKRAAPWMVALGVVRLVMLPVFMLAFVNRFAWFNTRQGYSYSSYYGSGAAYYPAIEWVPWAAVLAVVITLTLTFLEIAACTALGLATSAVARRGWLALVSALCIRLTPVIAFGAFTHYELGGSPSWQVLRFAPLALADSGNAMIYQLTLPLTYWTTTVHRDAMAGLTLATALLTAVTLISLFTAQHAIAAAGALPEKSDSLTNLSTPQPRDRAQYNAARTNR